MSCLQSLVYKTFVYKMKPATLVPYVARYGTKNYYIFSVTAVTGDTLLQHIITLEIYLA